MRLSSSATSVLLARQRASAARREPARAAARRGPMGSAEPTDDDDGNEDARDEIDWEGDDTLGSTDGEQDVGVETTSETAGELAGIDALAGLASLEVAGAGASVAIAYTGPIAGSLYADDADGGAAAASGDSARYLTLCSVDWLCASAPHAHARASRFEKLDLVTTAGADARGWFALRSAANGQLVQVAPPADAEAWGLRARAPARPAAAGDGSAAGGASARLTVSDLELFRQEGENLRNAGTRALINFRGIQAGDGVSIRAHGDGPGGGSSGHACRRPTPRTRFALRNVPPPTPLPTRADGKPICIALGVATRSRAPTGRARRATATTRAERLPLFRVLLPSLIGTASAADRRFRYELHLGFDDDDPFWSDPALRTAGAALFDSLVSSARLDVTLRLSEARGSRGAPCWVWSSLFSTSCAGGCEYFFQLNDDIRLVSEGWAEELVGTLASNPYLPNLGIAGPLDTNNPRLMTQSFAHCTHHEIFGYYYPREFKNWYSDDWATQARA